MCSSNTLRILLHVLHQHARLCEHKADVPHDRVMSDVMSQQNRQTSSHIIDIQDISRVYFSLPRQPPISIISTSNSTLQQQQTKQNQQRQRRL